MCLIFCILVREERYLHALNLKVISLDQKVEKIKINIRKDVSEVKEKNERELKRLDWRVQQ